MLDNRPSPMNMRIMSPKDKEEVRVAFQLPAHVVEDIDELAASLHQTRSQMYRWITVSFLESVCDKDEPPAIPMLLELARTVNGPKESTPFAPVRN